MFDVLCVFTFGDVFKVFALGRVVLSTVFMAFPLPQALVKNLAKTLVKNLAKHVSDRLTENCSKGNLQKQIRFVLPGHLGRPRARTT